MKYSLLIAEKPSAAKKIAQSLANGKPITRKKEGVTYFEITHGSTDIVVASAIGHLYSLDQKQQKKWDFPVFDVEWKEASKVNKDAKSSAKFIKVLKKLAKDADEVVVCCDYDQEGSLIGKNVVEYACKRDDASRMKFSTLTKTTLQKAYESRSKSLDWGQIKAGETRHILDWYNGINYSRALTAAIKAAGSFKIMSTGRVQGPALKIIVDREREIKKFKPDPFWLVQLLGTAKGESIEGWHEKDKIWKKDEAEKIIKNTKGQQAVVKEKSARKFEQAPPAPFDLTSLQIEAYRTLRVSPKATLAIAQELYVAGWISYPRTSSQKLPKELGLKELVEALKRQKLYKELAEKVLKTKLKPNEGKKDDPAHPAIHPTGEAPKALTDKKKGLYDLIVRRFLATFGEPAVRETNKLVLDCNSELFITKGTRTIHPGWHEFYGSFVKLEEEVLPKLEEGDKIEVKKINMLDKETQPPKRFTEASIIKELEKRNLGTKATRSSIVDTLFHRNYVDGKAIEATEFGMHTVDILEKYAPKIVDEELTRRFELELEKIENNKSAPKEVLKSAEAELKSILSDFKKKLKSIGDELKKANRKAQDIASTVGPCVECKGTLVIKRGKFGRFIACNKYPDCKVTASLPSSGMTKVTEKVCETCNWPIVTVIKKRRGPQQICINATCPSKRETDVDVTKIEEKSCEKCKEGKMVLRKSIYGQFLGCNRFPKCRNLQKL